MRRLLFKDRVRVTASIRVMVRISFIIRVRVRVRVNDRFRSVVGVNGTCRFRARAKVDDGRGWRKVCHRR